MASPISIWLVEDEQAYRDSFRQLIELTEEFLLDAEFETYEELVAFVEISPDAPIPDLIVMDIMLPGMSGIEATRDLRRRYPGLPVLALTNKDDPASLFAILRAGACGYVVKGTKPDATIVALREAKAGGTYFSPSVARHILGHFAEPEPLEEPLTEREREVLRELAGGYSRAGIGKRLYLSKHTVDSHIQSVYRKLHVTTGAEAVAKGVRAKLV